MAEPIPGFIDHTQTLREGYEAARRFRWVGPYCHDGERWRRPTTHEAFGRWMVLGERVALQSALAKNPFLRLLQKRESGPL